jgi:hypothetical protein
MRIIHCIRYNVLRPLIRGISVVTYISDEEMAALPEEPEEAFVALESIVRARYEQAYKQLSEHDSAEPLMRRYLSLVLPAAQHYSIEPLCYYDRPKDGKENWSFFDKFIADVDYRITELRLNNVERTKLYSVKLDAAAKIKLRHLLTEIRETVEALDISVTKKDRLYARINDLQEEVDRERTREQAFGALLIEACDDIGEAAKKLEPVVRLIERVGQAFGSAKRAENAQPRLPRPKAQKRIEAQKPAKEAPKPANRSFEKELDDEIPF